MACIVWLAPQDRGSGERFVALGLPADRLGPVLTLKSLPEQAGGAPAGPARAHTLLAASTHAGEDEVVLDAFVAARAALPGLRLILAPRHPRRRDGIEALIRARGLAFATRSRGVEPAEGLPVYLADTLGEMDRWYGMAGMTFVGGSLVEKGGHTPFEPAAHGSAILHGPHRTNFAPAYAALVAGRGAVEVANADDLAAAILALADPAAQAALAGRARAALAPFADKAATAAVLAALAAATGIAGIGQEPQTTGEPDAIHA
jgi:3-deoxy-D-manno-octulosonic-acid transferase